ncbi:MAG: Na+/H+ antiporter subunit E [Actinomycetota bacterium]|nr:Na+/H+ antiporter subunit E [Actinomycetota bacterium]MDP2287866.1 Na+/H+ antiporter subunit E [Actinomycetota bacterium]
MTLLRKLGRAVGRLPALAGLALWATVAIVRASAMVARDIVAPSARLAPGVLIVPLRCRTPLEVSLFTGLITLTPGTLVVGIDPRLTEVWVHGMYAADPEELRDDLIDIEGRVLRALRGRRAVPQSRLAAAGPSEGGS